MAADTVAATLPAGYRRDLVVATWADSPDAGSLRLSLGTRARRNAVAIRSDEVPPTASTEGLLYFRELGMLLTRVGARRLLTHLAQADRPMSVDDGPEPALRILRALGTPRDLMDRIHDRTALPVEVVHGLVAHGPAAFGAEVATLYRFLLTQNELDPVSTLRPYWSPELLESVVWTARAGVPPEWGAHLAEAFVAVAAGRGDLDEFLVRLLVTTPDGEATQELRRLALRRPETFGLAGLRSALVADRRAGTGLVTECQRSDPHAVPQLVEWLAGTRAQVEWLGVLLHVVAADRRDQPPVEPEVRAAAGQYRDVFVVAFAQASRRGDLGVLGAALWRLVLTSAAHRHPELRAYLRGGVVAARDPQSRARLDVALVATGDVPRAVQPNAAEARTYVTEMANALGMLPGDVRDEVSGQALDQVLEALTAPAGEDGREAAAVVLAGAVGSPTWRTSDVQATVAHLMRSPDREALLPHAARLAGPRWRRLVENNPELRRTVPRRVLHLAARDDTDAADLAEFWATFVVLAGFPRTGPRADLAELAHWPGCAAPGAVLELVDTTQALLREWSDVAEGLLRAWRVATLWSIVRRRSLGDVAAVTVAEDLRAVPREQTVDHQVVVGAGVPRWSWRRWWPTR